VGVLVGVAVGVFVRVLVGITVGEGELVGEEVPVPVTETYANLIRACADVVLSPIKRKFGV